MTSVPQRHTYYGAPASTYTQSRQSVAFGNTQKRKHVTFGPYIIGSTLGEGEFGKVKMGWSKISGSSSMDVSKQVAIKLVRRDNIPKNSEKEVKIYREINALKHLNHPNIVKLEEVLQNSKYIGIVLEYASGGEFYKYIQKKRRLKENAACRLFAQLISGVCYMHSKGLVHRDLKLENLLLDKQENLLITDFGFVNEFSPEEELMKTSCGSPCYAAPELVVTAKPYEARKADIWSCGVILYAMLAGYLPWDDDPDNPDGDDIGKLYRYITRTPLKFPDYITPVPRDLLRETLIADPTKRITTLGILQHRWLQPHHLFLAVTPVEWDHISKNQDILRRPPPRKDGASSTRPRSACSVSSSNSKGEKRNSLIMDSSLYSQPVPPQQSQSHAVAVSSSPSPRMRQSPVKRNRHSRSNSAASVALQAVVDAEKEYHATHPTVPTSTSASTLQFESPASSQHNTSPRLYQHALPKPSINTVSSLRDSVIVETSPQKGSAPFLITPAHNDLASGLVVPATLGNVTMPSTSAGQKTSHSTASHSLHSSSLHRRPRPTSYHPTSFSAFNESSTGTTTIAPSRKDYEETATVSSKNYQPTDRGSPQMIQKDSFTLSKPLVDLQLVTGDLIKTGDDSDSVAQKIHDQVEDAAHRVDMSRQRRKSQRYSMVYDRLVGLMTEGPEERVVEDEDLSKQNSESIPQGGQVKSASSNENKKRFSIMSVQPSFNNASKLSMESGNQRENSSDTGRLKNEDFATLHKLSLERDSAQSSRQSSRQRLSAKENEISGRKESPVVGSRIPSTKAAVDRKGSPQVITNASNVQRKVPLRKTSKNSQDKTKINRASVMISSMANKSVDGMPEARPREPSTAKKVIDFFKRRSMRL
ncbi:LADA_0C07338g1_1 [Lachancea dasiensis]|uniref:non-specific serine/threonine protein kinase n=1 Tax=Lachancea dasiensis TaxID=1072105 RepID=A0A1G4IZR0_9SACH|nr:LADA_0C07338g1_1 [Lachancea dasiensis]